MKRLTSRMLTLLLIAVLLLGGIARAQYVTHIVQVKVPFEFTVNEKVFPAGEYSIVRTAPSRLDLRDVRGYVLLSLITHSVQSREQSASTKLQFSTEGGGHALTQVWIKGDRIGNELAAPKKATVLANRNPRQPVEAGSGGNK
jgi:hypothetical protein